MQQIKGTCWKIPIDHWVTSIVIRPRQVPLLTITTFLLLFKGSLYKPPPSLMQCRHPTKQNRPAHFSSSHLVIHRKQIFISLFRSTPVQWERKAHAAYNEELAEADSWKIIFLLCKYLNIQSPCSGCPTLFWPRQSSKVSQWGKKLLAAAVGNIRVAPLLRGQHTKYNHLRLSLPTY